MRARIAILACVLISGVVGCDNRDADSLARVARCAAAKGEALAADTGGWQMLQSNLDESAIDARVSARLRWDKALEGTAIRVSSGGDGVELKGNVRSKEQRKRAREIAESTVGVEKVTVSLDIVP